MNQNPPLALQVLCQLDIKKVNVRRGTFNSENRPSKCFPLGKSAVHYIKYQLSEGRLSSSRTGDPGVYKKAN